MRENHCKGNSSSRNDGYAEANRADFAMMEDGGRNPIPGGAPKKTFVAIVWFGAGYNRRLLEFIFRPGND
jgi:hypothetical protein